MGALLFMERVGIVTLARSCKRGMAGGPPAMTGSEVVGQFAIGRERIDVQLGGSRVSFLDPAQSGQAESPIENPRLEPPLEEPGQLVVHGDHALDAPRRLAGSLIAAVSRTSRRMVRDRAVIPDGLISPGPGTTRSSASDFGERQD